MQEFGFLKGSQGPDPQGFQDHPLRTAVLDSGRGLKVELRPISLLSEVRGVMEEALGEHLVMQLVAHELWLAFRPLYTWLQRLCWAWCWPHLHCLLGELSSVAQLLGGLGMFVHLSFFIWS